MGEFKIYYDDGDEPQYYGDEETLKEAMTVCESFGADTVVSIYKCVKKGTVKSLVEWE